MDLIRQILINIQDGKRNVLIDGVDEDTFKYHQALLVETNLVDGNVLYNNQTGTDIPATVMIKKITWEGHDFIDAIQDEDSWAKVKSHLIEGGKIITLETIKMAIKQLFS